MTPSRHDVPIVSSCRIRFAHALAFSYALVGRKVAGSSAVALVAGSGSGVVVVLVVVLVVAAVIVATTMVLVVLVLVRWGGCGSGSGSGSRCGPPADRARERSGSCTIILNYYAEWKLYYHIELLCGVEVASSDYHISHLLARPGKLPIRGPHLARAISDSRMEYKF